MRRNVSVDGFPALSVFLNKDNTLIERGRVGRGQEAAGAGTQETRELAQGGQKR